MTFALLTLHGLFFATVLVRRFVQPPAHTPAPVVARTAAHTRRGRALVTVGVVAGAAFYTALFEAVAEGRVTRAVTPRGVIAGVLILGADLLVAWSLFTLRSWRLAPDVDPGHELCTTGPYRFVRHPIYLAFAILALATAAWVPTAAVISTALVLVVGGDIRTRLEERALVGAFGDDYLAYMQRVRRFVPGVY